MNRQDTSRHHPCRTHRCLAHFCSPSCTLFFHCISSPPLQFHDSQAPSKCLPCVPKVPSGLVGSATLPVPLASLHFLLWFARPVLDTRAAKTDRTPGGCSTSRSLYTCTDPSATRGNNNPPSAPTSAQSRRTHFPFSSRHCMAFCMPYSRRLFTARHQRKCSEPFKHQTALRTWHLGRPC
jgi:hypothetical protein